MSTLLLKKIYRKVMIFIILILGHLFVGFDGFWIAEKPKDIMEFNRVREAYRAHVILKLQDNSSVLPAMLQ